MGFRGGGSGFQGCESDFRRSESGFPGRESGFRRWESGFRGACSGFPRVFSDCLIDNEGVRFYESRFYLGGFYLPIGRTGQA